MSFKDAARKQWSERRELCGPALVPEWPDDDGQPAAIYAYPLTAAQRAQMRVLFSESRLGDDTRDAELLILMARDADGQPIWKKAERRDIARHYDPQIVDRLIGEINDLIGESADSAGGDGEADAPGES